MKLNTFSCCITLCGIPFIFSSCYTTSLPYDIPQARQEENIYYMPSSANAPLLKNKNDLSVSANFSINSKYGASELHAAFIPAAHFGVAANVSVSSQKGENNFVKPEIAVGYIRPLSPNWHFETYSGFGSTKVENLHATGKSLVRNKQVFIQPAISVHSIKNTVELGLVSRFAFVNFKVSDTTFNSLREPYSARQLYTLYTNPNHLFWEPGLTFRFGWKQILFNLNYVTSVHLNDEDFRRGNDNFSFGVSLRFNAANRKWKPF